MKEDAVERELDMVRLGERLRFVRTSRNQSRQVFAELCGISERYLTDIECGVKAPKLATLVRIANVIGVSAEYLLQDSLTAPDKSNLLSYALDRLSPKQKKILQDFLIQFLETMD